MDNELVKDFIARLLDEIDLLNLKIDVMDKKITLDQFLIRGQYMKRDTALKSDEYIDKCLGFARKIGIVPDESNMYGLLFGCTADQVKSRLRNNSASGPMYAGTRVCERCGEARPFSVFYGDTCNSCFDKDRGYER